MKGLFFSQKVDICPLGDQGENINSIAVGTAISSVFVTVNGDANNIQGSLLMHGDCSLDTRSSTEQLCPNLALGRFV